jgi:radical SAM superfamily enzyme YgiQ (UPF0313 family)
VRVTLLSLSATKHLDREYNAGLGSGFSIGSSLRARVLELMRSRMPEPPFLTFGYIAAILSQNGHSVASSTTIPDEGVVVIAPSLANYNADIQSIREVAANPRLRLVVVGHLASVRPHDFAKYAHLVIRGEPEAVMQEVRGDVLPDGVVSAEPIQDLDSLPFPRWDILPATTFRFSFAFSDAPFAFVQASRSCPYSCGYCPYITIGRYRQRSVSSVIAELAGLSASGIRGVIFRDPTFTLNRRWTLKLCEELITRRIPIRWECETRLDRLDRALLEKMKEAGLKSVKVGIESSDADVLIQSNRRPVSLGHQEEMVTACRELGVSVVAFYVLGLPSDTEQTVRATIEYAKQLNTDVARFHIFTPLPGTPLYDSVQDRIFESDWDKFDQFHVVFRHDHLSAETLLALKEEAYVSYYFRWRYLRSRAWRLVRRAPRPRLLRGARPADRPDLLS